MAENNLTPKQEKFIDKYLECGNASEAYRFAYDCSKYSEEAVWVNASKLLKNAKVLLMMKEKQAALREKGQITKEQVLDQLRCIMFADIRDYVDFDGVMISFKDFSKLTDDQAKAIESIKQGRNGIELKLHGKNWSIERICKMLGFDAPTQMVAQLSTGFEKMSDEELKQMIK